MDQYSNKIRTLVEEFSAKRTKLRNPDQNIKSVLVKIYNKESIEGVGPGLLSSTSNSGGLFGGSSSSSSSSLFGTPKNSGSAGLFSSPSQSAGGIFGGGSSSGSGGLFSSNQGTQQQSGGLFGGQGAGGGG